MDFHHDKNDSDSYLNSYYDYGVLQAETQHITTKDLFQKSNQFRVFEDLINDSNATTPFDFFEFPRSPTIELCLSSDSAGAPVYNSIPTPIPSVEPMQTVFSIHQDSRAVSPEFITTTPTSFGDDSPITPTGFTVIPTPPTAGSATSMSSSLDDSEELSVLKIKTLAMLVREESQRLCGAFRYKVKIKHQAGHYVQQHKYRLPAPGSLNVPYSPDWSRATSFPANRAFLNAVVEAVQGLPGHPAEKYSEDEIRRTANTYFKTLRKHWHNQKDNQRLEVDKENFPLSIDFNSKFD